MPVPVKATTSANALVVLKRDKAQGGPMLMYKVRIPTDQVATRKILMELMRARFTALSNTGAASCSWSNRIRDG